MGKILFFCVSLIISWGMDMQAEKNYRDIQAPHDLVALFHADAKQITEKMSGYCADVTREIEAILTIPDEQRTFANTIEKFDEITSLSNLAIFGSTVHSLGMLHPDEAVRAAANEAQLAMSAFYIDAISSNVALYRACKAYAEGNALKENLSKEQKYYLENLIDGYKKSGLDLPDEQRAEVVKLRKEIDVLTVQFQNNISRDTRTIEVSHEGLDGLSEEFINTLPRSENGGYVLGTDYPTYTMVMENCAVSATRKALYKTFNDRAYPANESILQEVREKRQKLATLLSFPSFAHLSLDDCMAQHPERVEKFLKDILEKAHAKESVEFELLRQHLPPSVVLTADNKLQPWDLGYVKACYKKEHLLLDERLIAEYFPQDIAMQGLFDIYQKFFNISFKELPAQGFWHEEVRLIEISDAPTNERIGYVLLDLHPRPQKYGHACEITIVPAVHSADGAKPPAVAIVVANFARPTAAKPALWHRTQAVQTLFHEFGHALHELLGRTSLAGSAGTNVKRDFVELPSQMLEYWLRDHAILKKISKHYHSGESLPDAMIVKIRELEQFGSGYHIKRQVALALLSLAYFKNSEGNPHDILVDIFGSLSHHVEMDLENHFYASFGHLMGYNARYYGYLWSEVFAHDIFAEIEKQGLLDPEVGARYVREVLGKGGSQDPNELLRNFLGREPNQIAFLAALGFDATSDDQAVAPEAKTQAVDVPQA